LASVARFAVPLPNSWASMSRNKGFFILLVFWAESTALSSRRRKCVPRSTAISALISRASCTESSLHEEQIVRRLHRATSFFAKRPRANPSHQFRCTSGPPSPTATTSRIHSRLSRSPRSAIALRTRLGFQLKILRVENLNNEVNGNKSLASCFRIFSLVRACRFRRSKTISSTVHSANCWRALATDDRFRGEKKYP